MNPIADHLTSDVCSEPRRSAISPGVTCRASIGCCLGISARRSAALSTGRWDGTSMSCLCPLGVRGSARSRADLDRALGAWIERLRIVVIDAGHPALVGLDDHSYEAMLVRTFWHEWGHALSLARATAADVAAGEQLVNLAPAGVGEYIRSAGYRQSQYTHEVIAEIYALLMARRRRGEAGQPAWLDDEIHELVRRVCGWNQ